MLVTRSPEISSGGAASGSRPRSESTARRAVSLAKVSFTQLK